MEANQLGFGDLVVEVDSILFYIWDPIGINSTLNARDEYTSYAVGVANTVLEGGRREILSQLQYIASKMIEMPLTRLSTCHKNATKALLELKEEYKHLTTQK